MAYRFVPRPLQSGLVALSLLAGATSCSSESAQTRDVELQFDLKIGSEKVACGDMLPGVGTNKRASTLKDLRFYVHDVQLTNAKGKKVTLDLPDDGVWQFKNVALLDFEDSSGDCRNGTVDTNALLRGRAPADTYTGVSFRVGVPFDLNHGNPAKASAPLTHSSLYWDWNQGFIFFKLDLNISDTMSGPSETFQVHLGSDRCTNSGSTYSCQRENVGSVELSGFDPQKDKIVLDLAALLLDANVASRDGDDAHVPGCQSDMSDPDCALIFPTLGLDIASGKPVATQTAFSTQEREAGDPGRTYPADAGIVLDDVDAGTAVSEYELKLPTGFPKPSIPADNPLTADKVELGRHLFYDKRLSGNQTQACADCHKQELAFTDGRAVGLGSTGELNIRGAMSLANIAYATTLTWARPDVKSLEMQANVPMFGPHPVELGLYGMEDVLLSRLRDVDVYKTMFPAAFPDDADPFTVVNVTRAIASFERTLISGNSPYDRFKPGGDVNAISESAKRGADLFFNPDPSGVAVECFHCHGGPTFSDQLTEAKQPTGDQPFHNTGLYNVDLRGSYPMGNEGVFEQSGDPHDKGSFKAPSLRNIEKTAPYMHDGSVATLEDVIANYARGGRLIEAGPNAGDGKNNPYKSEFIHGFSSLSAQGRADLVEFLKSLTDDEFLANPAYSNPWQK
jgi:cytochrome c peroxidase